MQFLAIEREVGVVDPRRHEGILRDEAARVWALRKADVIRDIWFSAPDRRAVLILECGSEEEARRHLASLPLVAGRLIEFDVLALRAYDGLERLFAG